MQAAIGILGLQERLPSFWETVNHAFFLGSGLHRTPAGIYRFASFFFAVFAM
jgi:hypothetical protein